MTELSHHVAFYDAQEYKEEKYPREIYSCNSDTKIPLPDEGQRVSFGYVEIDGERQDRWHFNASNTENGYDYVTDSGYEVESVKYHYHSRREHNDSGKRLTTNRQEVSTTVLLREVDGD